MRLQKYLSAAGVCSRRKAENYILEGRVSVNGVVVSRLGSKVDPVIDRVTVDGRLVRKEAPKVYIALNKPAGYVSSCFQKQEKTVLELVPGEERIVPVGRLDKDSTGLLLLTNDGALHNRLTHPSFDHEKVYEVTTATPLTNAELDMLRKGIRLGGRKTRPAKVQRLSDRRFRITLKEGRNRQIRRMTAKLGHRVTALHRIRLAGLDLAGLKEGDWRYLSDTEKQRLLLRGAAPPR
ncbi:MAG: pseudouridine synthase [Desulfosudaceae bacterium]